MHWLTDPFQTQFMVRALVATVIIGAVAPVVGTWVVLRRMANLGDAMAHGTLAGVGIAYAAGINVLFGAIGVGLVLAALLIGFSSNRRLANRSWVRFPSHSSPAFDPFPTTPRSWNRLFRTRALRPSIPPPPGSTP